MPSKNTSELVEKFLKDEEQSMIPGKCKYSPPIKPGKKAHKKLLHCAHKSIATITEKDISADQ